MMWVAKEAAASSRSELGSDLEEAAAGSHAARSTQASRRRLLPRERATAIARPSKEEPGVTSWVAPLRPRIGSGSRSEEHTSELQSHLNLVCRLLLEKKNKHY